MEPYLVRPHASMGSVCKPIYVGFWCLKNSSFPLLTLPSYVVATLYGEFYIAML